MFTNLRESQPEEFNQISNLVELVRYRSLQQPEQTAFIYLEDGEIESKRLTYRELDLQAQAIAANLQSLISEGERALLLYPAGLDFIAAFFGCLYGGIIAVPAYPPRPNHHSLRLEHIIENSQAKVVLSTESLFKNISRNFEQHQKLSAMSWLRTDQIETDDASNWREIKIESHNLAFFQYTSGSTGNPKGVMVSHANLLDNSQLIYQCYEHYSNTKCVVSWLPTYHDMGLIGGVLQPIYAGIPLIFMSPVSFLQKPFRWLQVISHYQATTSGGPNFAYDLCLRKITPEQIATLDLSSWEVAFTGAEPVQAITLERFAEKFAPCGFRFEAFQPCYGMAEATLFISGGLRKHPPIIKYVNESALEQNQVIVGNPAEKGTRPLVGCGQVGKAEKILIVNPETLIQCKEDEVGEIWVSGPSVAQGYWQQPEKTTESLQAHLADTGEGPFLRTGDLGFLQDQELFITGRIKDVIVIRGCNHYPQDLEHTVEQSHPALIPNRSAAFSVTVAGNEKLVVVSEVERRFGATPKSIEGKPLFVRSAEPIDPGFEVNIQQPLAFEDVINAIRQAIATNHGSQVHAVLLLRVGTIPKTSSGKIQRYACRQGFLESTLTVVYPHQC
jgi:acyl-CoA synthetase (AMP-forming)/AMP-acid ligase II